MSPCSASSNARRSLDRSFNPVEVVQRHRAVSRRAHAVETVPQRLQRLVEALAANQRAVQTELPGNVREESELRSVHPARAQTLDRAPLPLQEGLRRMEPAIDLEVMLDTPENGRELVAAADRCNRPVDRPDAAIHHPPQIRQHRTDPGDGRSRIARGEKPMEQEVQVGERVRSPAGGRLASAEEWRRRSPAAGIRARAPRGSRPHYISSLTSQRPGSAEATYI